MEIQTHAANSVVRTFDRFGDAFKHAMFVDNSVSMITWWEDDGKTQVRVLRDDRYSWTYLPFDLTDEEWGTFRRIQNT